jgi:hypothetical protein
MGGVADGEGVPPPPAAAAAAADDDFAWSSRRYDLIIAADGLRSSLRSRYAGHASTRAGGSVPRSPPSSSTSAATTATTNAVEYGWEHGRGQREATQVEDRGYVVFRGNAPGPIEEGGGGGGGEGGGGSFQTWGEDRGMRFAAVPFIRRAVDSEDGDGEEKEEVVWFATISDPSLVEYDTLDAAGRKRLLLEAFGSWHDPVRALIESTPAGGIMYEPAVAHRHCANPVFDVGRIMEYESWQERTGGVVGGASSSVNGPGRGDDGRVNGDGPILVFIGDAMMSVDPVLAQGFTIAMESGASVVRSIERVLVRSDDASVAPLSTALRDELLQRNARRERRLVQLLRSTELVQRMAQPSGLGSILSTWIVRPVIKMCPEVVKMRVFDYVIRYSLGLTG